ncbi:hypothetical protein SUGI_0180200 [Cryptomeria japonica]|nr:hypothetical protein SUGI_0180200 [Cryptomeria japonica]
MKVGIQQETGKMAIELVWNGSCHFTKFVSLYISVLFLLTTSQIHGQLFSTPSFPQNPAENPNFLQSSQNPRENPQATDENLLNLKILLEKQESHLQKLEALIETLQRSVNDLGAPPRGESSERESPAGKIERGRGMNEGVFEEDEERSGRKERKGITVAKYKPAWTERFQFLSAVKIGTNATCLNVLPHEDEEGVSKYVAVGDDQGRVYVFLSHGDVLVDYLTLSSAPVTAMLSYMSVSKNETVLVTGHADGAVLLHRLWEITQAAGGGGHGGTSGEDWHVLAMEHVRTLSIGGAVGEEAAMEQGVTLLEVHQVGRMRYILGVNRQGRIHVFRENGTVYGIAQSGSRPLAFLKQRLLFLTETGAGSLDLRSMTVRTGECEGLNGSRAVTYVFDAVERFKGQLRAICS